MQWFNRRTTDSFALIMFFSQDIQKWDLIPDAMEECWVNLGQVDTSCTHPAEFLCLVLLGLLNDLSDIEWVKHTENTVNISQDVIFLLNLIILNVSPASIFLKKDHPDDWDRVWSILSILCSAIVKSVYSDSMKNVAIDFDYFYQAYSSTT